MMARCLALLLLFATPTAHLLAAGHVVETVATGLEHPWSMAWLPDGTLLVTERPGRLRVVRNGELNPTPVAGVPPVHAVSQGGLFDVLPHPDFANNQLLYLSLAHGTAQANTTRIVRGRFDGTALTDVEVVFSASPTRNTPVHYGGRMAWLADGTLLLTTGDGYNRKNAVQALDNHLGKTLRLTADGAPAPGNPLLQRPGAAPEVWTWGHRSPQGLAVDPVTGRVWQHEHGAQGGDELNLLHPGGNYGWPLLTTGIDYTGGLVTPLDSLPGTTAPITDWVPSIAPSGLAVYRGNAFPDWQGDLFVGALVDRTVVQIKLDADGQVVSRSNVFPEIAERIRDVRVGPDGFLYVSTDTEDGQVLRVRPAP